MTQPSDGEAAQHAVIRLRDEARREASVARAKLSDIRDARRDTPSDDEHDPEGPTLAFEWSMAQAALSSAERDEAEADAALRRIADGQYGVCAECGRPIASARLAARPLETLCIECARAAERRGES